MSNKTTSNSTGALGGGYMHKGLRHDASRVEMGVSLPTKNMDFTRGKNDVPDPTAPGPRTA
jgi:hypothetical protein